MRSRVSRSLLEYVCLFFQRIELLAVPYEVPLICKVVAAALWDHENREIDGASPRGCIFSKCIPREVQAQQGETNQNTPRRIPILYVPLRIFGCLGAVLEGVHCNNLMHFVHKLMHPSR